MEAVDIWKLEIHLIWYIFHTFEEDPFKIRKRILTKLYTDEN